MRRFYTVTTTKARNVKNGNGSTTVFPFDFVYLDADDITVTLVQSDGTEVVKTLTTDYTLSGGNGATGSVTTTSFTPASGEQLVIERSRDYTQETDYVRRDPFDAEVNELALDSIVMLVQQLKDIVERAIRLPITTDPDNPVSLTIPQPVTGQILVGNSGATGWDNADAASFSAVALPLSLANGGLGASHANVGEVLDTLGFSANAKSLIAAANYAAMRALLDLEAGTDFVAYSAFLNSLGSLNGSIVAGDIIYGSAANTAARLAKGTDGQVLTLASGLPSWADAAGGGWQPISSGTVSGSPGQIDVSFTPASWKRVRLLLRRIRGNTSSAIPWIRTSSNSGSSFDVGASDYRWQRFRGITGAGTPASGIGTKIVIGEATANADGSGESTFEIEIVDPSNTSDYIEIFWRGWNGGPTNKEYVFGGGIRDASAAVINAIRFMYDTGTIAEGEWILEGVPA